ncbi:Protein of unknown function [Gryllus bimaculatus]|nr:Protein of unknown function [Gryllus bimaculatus]
MLRERMPLYSIRYRETIHSESVRKRRREMLGKKREVVRNTAIAQLEQLRRARMEKNYKVSTADYKNFFHTLERCYEYLVGQSEHVMPMKRSFQEALYNLAGIGYLDIKTLRKDDSEERRMLQAQMIMSVVTPHGHAIDAVLAGTCHYEWHICNL